MTLRLFSLLVAFFWAASVAWLCAVVWAPPGSRMARIDPREAYRVFFEWNDSTNMTLLENGRRRGQLAVAGGSGVDEATGEFERFLSLSGSMDRYEEGDDSPVVDLFWKGAFFFTEAMESRGGEVSVRVPSLELSAQVAFDAPPSGGKPAVQARVVMAGQEILALEPGEEAPKLAGSVEGVLGSLPVLGLLDPSTLEFTTEARSGSFTLGGREMQAFLLVLRGAEPSQSLRVYLSEAGEPLRIETDLGMEAVSEILVPLDAYQRRPRSDHD